MTVAELIEKLREMPQDLAAARSDAEWGPQIIGHVEVDEIEDWKAYDAADYQGPVPMVRFVRLSGSVDVV